MFLLLGEAAATIICLWGSQAKAGERAEKFRVVPSPTTTEISRRDRPFLRPRFLYVNKMIGVPSAYACMLHVTCARKVFSRPLLKAPKVLPTRTVVILPGKSSARIRDVHGPRPEWKAPEGTSGCAAPHNCRSLHVLYILETRPQLFTAFAGPPSFQHRSPGASEMPETSLCRLKF